MADLSGLSDADLQAAANGDMTKMSDDGLKIISDQSKGWGAAENAYASNPTIDVNGLKNSVVNNLPTIGGIAGGMIGNVPGAGLGGAAGQAAKDYFTGYTNSDGTPETMSQRITRPLISGGIQAAGQGIGNMIAPAVSGLLGKAGEAFSGKAADEAMAASGLTGKQMNKILQKNPDAGEQLLKYVGFGDTQGTIADKLVDAYEQSGKNISDSLGKLDAQGATVDQQDIVNQLKQRAETLRDDTSQFPVADKIDSYADQIQGRIAKKGGQWQVPISAAEQTKRGFQNSANYNDPSVDAATKQIADVYRQTVENNATKLDPATANLFTQEKQTFGLLKPLQEGAVQRSLTTQQSPKGGLLDQTAAIVGDQVLGPAGAFVLPPLQRGLRSRISPSLTSIYGNAGNALTTAAPYAGIGTAPAAQIALPQALYGLMAPQPTQTQQLPNHSTIPGKNGH